MSLFASKTISSEVKHRAILHLLHSTHLYKNFPLILRSSSLDTARSLIERYGQARARHYLHDPNRYEQLAVGLDYINCSLTVPNYELLYHRSKSSWKQEWIHLDLDLSLLYKEETKFSPVSAAQAQGKYICEGWSGFTGLFAEQVEDFTRADLPRNTPTHPQAEVLVLGPLPISLIQRIYVSDAKSAIELERLIAEHNHTLKVEIAPHLFVWPERLHKI
jgi:hypothetical protein